MNIVLYSMDMEPITVINLPLWAIEHAHRQGSVNVAVLDAPSLVAPRSPIPDSSVLIAVRLEFHKLPLRDKVSWMVTVDNDVAALKLTPSCLPGQRGKINNYERNIRKLSSALLDVLSRGVGGH